MDNVHSINAVTQRTGLSPHVIRVWERRYKAVKPVRTPGNRRAYSEEDVTRLLLLHQAIHAGHRIGHIANLTTDALRDLVGLSVRAVTPDNTLNAPAPPVAQCDAILWTESCMNAVMDLNAAKLEELLSQASIALGQDVFLQRLIAPLINNIGCAWQAGDLRVAHEHMATAIIRSVLEQFPAPSALGNPRPRLIVTTPTGQWHELGAILVAATGKHLGWQVLYLGPSLPAEEIAHVSAATRSHAVALSIVHPDNDTKLPLELQQLRKLLPTSTVIIAGGRAAGAYKTALQNIGATLMSDLSELSTKLDHPWRPPSPPSPRATA